MNVLKDPWIPVWTQKNQHIRVTLPTFYEHTHEYHEFSLARFLALSFGIAMIDV